MSTVDGNPIRMSSFLDAVGGQGGKLTFEMIQTAKRQVESASETGWVIVKTVGDFLQYYAIRDYEFGKEVVFTCDSNLAVRFARKQDADNVIDLAIGRLHGDVRAEEHMWINFPRDSSVGRAEDS